MKFIATSYLIYVRLKIRRNVQSVKKTTNCLCQISWWKKWEKFSSKLCQRLEKKESRLESLHLALFSFFYLLRIFEYLGIVISRTVRQGAFISNDSCFRRYQGDGPYGHFQVTVLILAVSSHQIYQFRYLKWTPKAPAYCAWEVPFVRRKLKAGVQQRVKRAGSLWSG